MSDVRDKSPWYGTAEDGLRWILRDETCKTEQIELVAEKALEKIEALLSLSADRGREIESLQRERDEARSLASYWRYVADPGGIRKPFSETRPFPWERSGE